MFLTTRETLCAISRSLIRWITWRSLSRVQRASSASSSHSSTREPGTSWRERLSVSGRIMRKVELKVATISTLERLGGVRRLSSAVRTAFRARADDDWRRTSRVSLLAAYCTDAATTSCDMSFRAKNWASQLPNPPGGASSEMEAGWRQAGRGYWASVSW